MIPDIGVMVGMYIVTRMVALIFKKDSPVAPKILGAVTILVALFCIADLFAKGSSGIPH